MHKVIFKDSNIDLLNRVKKLTVHWVHRSLILFPPDKPRDYKYSILTINDIDDSDDDLRHQTFFEIPLKLHNAPIDPTVARNFPHLAHFVPFKIDDDFVEIIPACLRRFFFAVIRDHNDNIVDAAGIQIPGILDDLFRYDGPLGVQMENGVPTLRVWAPTASVVTLHLFSAAQDPQPSQMRAMLYDKTNGVWSITGNPDWVGKFYQYRVQVFCPCEGQFVDTLTSDPYSISLSTNGTHSQIIDLADRSLTPAGWDTLQKPPLHSINDISIYEMHMRDFSIGDPDVPAEYRGTYKAFTVANSGGMKHLRAHAEAGLTHLHLLPVSDIASINEDKSTWKKVEDSLLRSFPPNSDLQSQIISTIQNDDGYNWGYDPHHFMAPEGSYSTDPNGQTRVLEFREMVQAVNNAGLRLVMDVVFNHTYEGGLGEKSVFDKLVPGYYHRLNFEGGIENSTCCANTATEHAMMRKLMVDSILLWATAYKVDGFRFDLMGHHMVADMQAVRVALDSLTIEKDGVDGKKIYLYGEAWDFGEVANNTRGTNASMRNIAGNGIGVFNDRCRDALRGGSAFSGMFDQGFATGLYTQANHEERRNHDHQKWVLFEYCDLIKASLAGNLKEYRLTRASGEEVFADQIWYNDQPAALLRNPSENVLYVSAHDNETLWDILQVKTPHYVSVEDRVRLNNLALSVIALGQGIPFFFSGDDMLRSKSLDRDSYNSGDWFNQIDWSYKDNNWGKGLPIKGRDKWFIFSHLLADEKRKPSESDIRFAVDVFRMFLRIRKSSPLFRLQSADLVIRDVSFLNNGPHQIPGLIAMNIEDPTGIDPQFSSILVLFNANPGAVYFGHGDLAGLPYRLHPEQVSGPDEIVRKAAFNPDLGEFVVPARTCAVFVISRTSG